MRQEEKEARIELAEGLSKGRSQMCDYSLHSIKSRPAKIGDKLTARDFGTSTRGFAASEDATVAVCVLPGTELAFAHEVERLPTRLWPWHDGAIIVTGVRDGQPFSANGRVTFVVAKRRSDWEIVHFHRSAMPN